MTVYVVFSPVVKLFWFVCGPTCGCGHAFPAVPGEEMECPHCGRRWGRAPIIAKDDAAAEMGFVSAVRSPG